MRERKLSQFYENSQKAMDRASMAANSFNHRFIEHIHLLIGLSHERGGIGGRILFKHGIREAYLIGSLEEVGLELNLSVTRAKVSHRLQQTFQYAVDETIRTKKHRVGTDHLLLGLTMSEDQILKQVFSDTGIDVDDIRNDVYKELNK